MKKRTKALVSAATAVCMAGLFSITASASVSGAVTSTWNNAKAQIQQVVNNVVFPCIDLILGGLLFVKIATAYLEYRKHGQLEWTPIAIIFGGLLFSITAPLYVWQVI